MYWNGPFCNAKTSKIIVGRSFEWLCYEKCSKNQVDLRCLLLHEQLHSAVEFPLFQKLVKSNVYNCLTSNHEQCFWLQRQLSVNKGFCYYFLNDINLLHMCIPQNWNGELNIIWIMIFMEYPFRPMIISIAWEISDQFWKLYWLASSILLCSCEITSSMR